MFDWKSLSHKLFPSGVNENECQFGTTLSLLIIKKLGLVYEGCSSSFLGRVRSTSRGRLSLSVVANADLNFLRRRESRRCDKPKWTSCSQSLQSEDDSGVFLSKGSINNFPKDVSKTLFFTAPGPKNLKYNLRPYLLVGCLCIFWQPIRDRSYQYRASIHSSRNTEHKQSGCCCLWFSC